ncbi:MAG TPA: HAMP domain-containing sensor histidine kinase [Trebonia sp.]|jgi:signal transduction histidine kinase|nr:HAMP domain-containing sensor histidine kinase [Trebonia sp.]
MARRILLALLALTATLLVAAAVPLALKATQHDQQSYVAATVAAAHSLATVADQQLADNATDARFQAALRTYHDQGGDELLLATPGLRVVTSWGTPVVGWQRLARISISDGSTQTLVARERVVVTEPIWNDQEHSDNPIGVMVLERPTAALTDSTSSLWVYVGLLAAAAMLAAAAIALTFARWVSKPLVTMDSAARQLADGNLSVRATTGSGPPELRRMAASFNMMAGRLETLVHGHRAMLADVSHQLRTPLAALRLRIDLLSADAGPAAKAELAGAQDEIARLSRLVDGLLAMARAESLTEQRVVINLLPAVMERVAAWQPVADGSGVKLLVDPAAPAGADATDLRVALGVGHLEQILDNLLANAIEALPGGGRVNVAVAVAVADAGSRLVVADDGPGMPPAERSRAFLRFFTASQNGTGLGLAIVHRLVTSNGGSAKLSETPGGGLTVALDFPEAAVAEVTDT